MKQILNNAISSGVPNVSYNHSVDMELIAKLSPVEINRNFKRRVRTMNKHFVKDVTSIHDYTLFNVKDDLDVPVGSEIIEVKPGLTLADGNTRSESYREGKKTNFSNGGYNPQHTVNAKIVDIHTHKQYLEEYYSIDSSSATETSPDILRGAIGFLEINLISNKAQAGTWGSALQRAYPGDPKDTPLWKVQYFNKELELLDKCGVFTPTSNGLKKSNQHLICASLIAAKLYSTPKSNQVLLMNTLQNLARYDFTDLKTKGSKWSGVTALIYQVCTSGSTQDKGWIPAEYVGSTKGKSWKPAMGFYLHCIEKEMTDKLTNHTSDFKHSYWENQYVETLELLENLFPSS